jgi:GT2 family glycosyltransferase
MTSMNHETDVACIVANWNGGERVLSCLRALGASEGVSVHIILVDNGSADGSLDRVREEFPGVEVIVMGENAGLARARNRGVAHALRAGFQYILFVDDDARVGSTTLALLQGTIRGNPRCGIVTPRIYDSQRAGRIWYDGGRVNCFGDAVHTLSKERTPDERTSRVTAFATGCCSMIARGVFEKIGFLDEDFFIYSEDVDFSFRARAAGYSILHVPGASAWHEQSSAAKHNKGKWFRDYYVTRNKLLLYGKHYHRWRRSAALISFSVRWFLVPLAYTFLRGEWKRDLAIVRGLADYHRKRLGGTYR